MHLNETNKTQLKLTPRKNNKGSERSAVIKNHNNHPFYHNPNKNVLM